MTNGSWNANDQLHARALEQWGKCVDKMGAVGETLDKLGDVVLELTKAVEMVGNKFDELGPLLDELEDRGK